MTNAFVNFKIGNKLAILMIGAVLQLVLIGCLCLWALHSIHTSSNQAESDSEKMLAANRISADIMRITTLTGHIALSTG